MAAHDYNWLWRQENQEFMAIVGYTDWVSKTLNMRLCFKKLKKVRKGN